MGCKHDMHWCVGICDKDNGLCRMCQVDMQAEAARLKSLLQKVSDCGSEYAADGYAEVHISHALRQDIKNELAGRGSDG